MAIEWEIENLACRACGKSEEETDTVIDASGVDDLLFEKYGIDFESYCAIVKDLVPFTNPWRAALSGEAFRGFVDGHCAIVKVPLAQESQRDVPVD